MKRATMPKRVNLIFSKHARRLKTLLEIRKDPKRSEALKEIKRRKETLPFIHSGKGLVQYGGGPIAYAAKTLELQKTLKTQRGKPIRKNG
jgi:hypothetical protein